MCIAPAMRDERRGNEIKKHFSNYVSFLREGQNEEPVFVTMSLKVVKGLLYRKNPQSNSKVRNYTNFRKIVIF